MSEYTFTINNQAFDVKVGSIQGNIANVSVNQVPYKIVINGSGSAASPAAPAPKPAAPAAPAAAPKAQTTSAPAAPVAPSGGEATITAPIPGKVLSVNVKEGDQVAEGQIVAVIEAMKMENTVTSPVSGTVKKIAVDKDAEISTDDLLMVIG